MAGLSSSWSSPSCWWPSSMWLSWSLWYPCLYKDAANHTGRIAGDIKNEMVCVPVAGQTPRLANAGPVLVTTSMILVVLLLLLLSLLRLWWKRQRAWCELQESGLPTVVWYPRWMRRGGQDMRLVRPSSITNILPRMQRLQGPHGMYATLYGISTKVVHMAHPLPIRRILLNTTPTPTVDHPETDLFRRFFLFSSASSSSSHGIAHSVGATKCPAYSHFENFSGHGVFTAHGDDWKAKRVSVLHFCVASAAQKTTATTTTWETQVHQAAHGFLQRVAAARPGPLNVVPLLQRTTLGLIFQFLTHRNLTEDETWTNHPNGTTQSPTPWTEDQVMEYIQAVSNIRMIILAKARSPWFLLLPSFLYRWTSPLYRQEQRTLRSIRRLALVACQAAAPDSPMARLAQCASHGGATAGSGSPTRQMMDEAITLLFAGQDTSASTLSWTLHLLSLHPAIQEALAQQVLAVTQRHRNSPNEKDPGKTDEPVFSKEDFSKMPLLDAVIRESMRLYPVVPLVVRRLPHAISVPSPAPAATAATQQQQEDNKTPPTLLPAGTVACMWTYSLHRNEDFWQRPLDFDPQRWLDPKRDVLGKQQAYMPFCLGPRNCLGQSMARVVLRTVLARIVQHYRLVDSRLLAETKPSEKTDPHVSLRKEMQVGFTVMPEGGVHLHLIPRQDVAEKEEEEETSSTTTLRHP